MVGKGYKRGIRGRRGCNWGKRIGQGGGEGRYKGGGGGGIRGDIRGGV